MLLKCTTKTICITSTVAWYNFIIEDSSYQGKHNTEHKKCQKQMYLIEKNHPCVKQYFKFKGLLETANEENNYLSDVTKRTGRHVSFAPKAIILQIKLSWYMDPHIVASSITAAFFRTSMLFITSFGYLISQFPKEEREKNENETKGSVLQNSMQLHS